MYIVAVYVSGRTPTCRVLLYYYSTAYHEGEYAKKYYVYCTVTILTYHEREYVRVCH
jgi:hypothetical protein